MRGPSVDARHGAVEPYGTPLWFDTWYSLVHAGLGRPDWDRALTELGFPPAPDVPICVIGAPKRWLAKLAAPHRHDALTRLAHALAVPLPRGVHLDLDGLRRLRQSGWRIGSHGVDHVRLADADVATLTRELDGSLRMLAEVGDTASPLFAYPDGAWSPAVMDAVAVAGFALAFTTDRGPWTATTDRLLVPRWFCRGDDAAPHRSLAAHG